MPAPAAPGNGASPSTSCREAEEDERCLSRALRACERDQRGAEGLHLLYHYRAVARFRKGPAGAQAAVLDATAALSIEPGFTPAACCCAAALETLGRLGDAAALLDRALGLDTSGSSAREAHALRQRINEARAKQALNTAAASAASAASKARKQRPQSQHGPLEQEQEGEGPSPSGRVVELQAAEAGGSAAAAAGDSPSRHPKGILPSGQLDPEVWPPELRRQGRPPPHIFVPSADGISSNLLLMLHGLGDKPQPYAALARRMGLPQTCALALSGPLEVPETDGGRAWFEAFEEDYELIQPTRSEQRRSKSLAASTQLLRALVQRLVRAGWSHRSISLFGFSQGGSAAIELHLSFQGADRLGGCVSIAGPMLQELLWAREEERAGGHGGAGSGAEGGGCGCGPVLITRGDRDSETTLQAVQGTLEQLRRVGCAARLHVVPGKGHGMIGSEGEMRACMAFWAETLCSRPPGEGVVELQR